MSLAVAAATAATTRLFRFILSTAAFASERAVFAVPAATAVGGAEMLKLFHLRIGEKGNRSDKDDNDEDGVKHGWSFAW